MSHIPGHVITPPKSPGELRSLKGNGKVLSEIVRIPEDYKGKVSPDQRVGFHPRIDDKGEVWATDIVDWDAHVQAEQAVMSDASLKLGVTTFEELRGKSDLQSKIKQALDNGKFSSHKDVITRTLNYITTDDFRLFYVNEDQSIRKQDDIIDEINKKNKDKILGLV